MIPGQLRTTEENVLGACQDNSSFPVLSLSVTVLPAEADQTFTMMTPWVEEASKFCAMPEAPAAMTVPPVTVPFPA